MVSLARKSTVGWAGRGEEVWNVEGRRKVRYLKRSEGAGGLAARVGNDDLVLQTQTRAVQMKKFNDSHNNKRSSSLAITIFLL